MNKLTVFVYLVAHNVNKSDFPFMKEELEKVGITLYCNTVCTDSYLGIQLSFCKKVEILQNERENALDNSVITTPIIGYRYSVIENENSMTERKESPL